MGEPALLTGRAVRVSTRRAPEALLRSIRLGEDARIELKAVVLAGERVKEPGREQLFRFDEQAVAYRGRSVLEKLGGAVPARRAVRIDPMNVLLEA